MSLHSQNDKESISVLLVDDSEDDRLFLRRALRRNSAFRLVGELCDGDAAMSWLAGEGKYGDRQRFPFPQLLLLDLKLPKKTGYEVLEWLQDRGRDGLYVVVLSGSSLPQDIKRCEELGADGHFKKEALEEEQLAMVAGLEKLVRIKFSQPVQA
jgi:CheY-like chemotaxis protein